MSLPQLKYSLKGARDYNPRELCSHHLQELGNARETWWSSYDPHAVKKRSRDEDEDTRQSKHPEKRRRENGTSLDVCAPSGQELEESPPHLSAQEYNQFYERAYEDIRAAQFSKLSELRIRQMKDNIDLRAANAAAERVWNTPIWKGTLQDPPCRIGEIQIIGKDDTARVLSQTPATSATIPLLPTLPLKPIPIAPTAPLDSAQQQEITALTKQVTEIQLQLDADEKIREQQDILHGEFTKISLVKPAEEAKQRAEEAEAAIKENKARLAQIQEQLTRLTSVRTLAPNPGSANQRFAPTDPRAR
ncbi:hypothetical protein HDV00_004329 [Rhizophlyctis rosea]|nr:hypothetical protein HDV00_004329 [Rhizophlyctis rosea]